MPFIEISGKNIRNLQDFHFNPSPDVNVIAGKNGAGKTNLLEAIYLNSLGRSFRTSAARNIISDKHKGCWVFSEYQTTTSSKQPDKLGVERRKGNYQKISINGVHYNSLAKLAALAPVLAIQPSETQLIDGASALRRKYLDWLMFHVEPGFLEVWRDNQRLLKQRNQLLRRFLKKPVLSATERLELRTWDIRFIESAESLSEMRESTNKALVLTIKQYLAEIPAFSSFEDTLSSLDISVEFFKGWAKDEGLSEALEQGLEQDLKRGFTRSGAHRSDLILKANGFMAKDYLSRGQKKLLAMVMRLAQAEELKAKNTHPPVILLDDLFAELDEESVEAFIKLTERLKTQVFLTCLNTETRVKDMFERPTKVFHVEQGSISE